MLAARAASAYHHGFSDGESAMAEKKPEKFVMKWPDGTIKELEVPPSNIDPNHPLLRDLQVQLLRLRPGEQPRLPHGHFDAVSTDPMELTHIGEVGILFGCNVHFDEQISATLPFADMCSRDEMTCQSLSGSNRKEANSRSAPTSDGRC